MTIRLMFYSSAIIVLSLASIVRATFVDATSDAKKRKPDREFHQLNGPVKTVQVETASLTKKSGTWIEKDRIMARVDEYDRNGDINESVFYHLGRAINRTVYNYDKNGDREGREYFPNFPRGVVIDQGANLNPDGSITEKWKVRYDAEGRITEEIGYGGVSGYRQVIGFDGSGRKQTVEVFEGKRLKYRTVFTYDSQGRVTGTNRYDNKGQLTNKEFFAEFDAYGNWAKSQKLKPVTKDGKEDFEPVEVTYRTVTYY